MLGFSLGFFKSICEQCACRAEAQHCSDGNGVICSMLINQHLQPPLLPIKSEYKIELFDLTATEVCLHDHGRCILSHLFFTAPPSGCMLQGNGSDTTNFSADNCLRGILLCHSI